MDTGKWPDIISKTDKPLALAALAVLMFGFLIPILMRNSTPEQRQRVFFVLLFIATGFGGAAVVHGWPAPAPPCEKPPPVCHRGTFPASDRCLPEPTDSIDAETRRALRIRCDGLAGQGINHDGYVPTSRCGDHEGKL